MPQRYFVKIFSMSREGFFWHDVWSKNASRHTISENVMQLYKCNFLSQFEFLMVNLVATNHSNSVCTVLELYMPQITLLYRLSTLRNSVTICCKEQCRLMSTKLHRHSKLHLLHLIYFKSTVCCSIYTVYHKGFGKFTQATTMAETLSGIQ